MKSLVLKVDGKELRDGTIFRIGTNKYRINFSEAGFDYNVDLWSYRSYKPLSTIGTIKRSGVIEFDRKLYLIDEILN